MLQQRHMHAGPPISAFQKAIRGSATVLRDHICKEMNELNLERCRCIPKNVPGADWRVLQEIVDANPERTLYKVQIWRMCLQQYSDHGLIRCCRSAPGSGCTITFADMLFRGSHFSARIFAEGSSCHTNVWEH